MPIMVTQSHKLSDVLTQLRDYSETSYAADEISDAACYIGEDVTNADAFDIFECGFKLCEKLKDSAPNSKVFYGLDEIARVFYFFIAETESEVLDLLVQYVTALRMNEELVAGKPTNTFNPGED